MSSTPLSANARDAAKVALGLSRRLNDFIKMKNILNIEAGIEMIALAMMISSEVRDVDGLNPTDMLSLLKNGGVFPETYGDVDEVLRRFEIFSYLLY